MLVQVHVKGLARASRLRSFAAAKLNGTLARFSHAVREVSVRMHDVNGPHRGGIDKLCRVVLRLRDNSVLVVEELGINMTEVIDRTTDRLHHIVSKRASRLVEVERSGTRRHGMDAATA